MKGTTITALGGAIAIVASLLLAQVHPFGDPGLNAATGAQTTLLEHSAVLPEVRAALIAKCSDCHSNRTHTPLYGRFAPISWLMERDVLQGRKALNLSRWDGYTADQQQILVAKILKKTKSREMPLVQYRIIHRSATITDADTAAFTKWARGFQTPVGASMPNPVAEGDPVRGNDLFKRRCSGCHALTQNREGPSLHGVYGRRSGVAAGFSYSAALSAAHIVWDDSTLEKWLTEPDALVPGSNMDFHVANPQERTDLISFFRKEARP